MTCPDLDQLLVWRDTADDASAAGVASHLSSGCSTCATRLELLDTMAVALGEVHAEPGPELQRRTLQALARAGTSATPSPPRASAPGARAWQALGEWLGTLVAAPDGGLLAAGLRGDDDPRPRRYEAGPVLLEVGLVDGEALLGQLSDRDPEQPVVDSLIGASVTLFTGSRVLHDTVDALGGFHFAHGPEASCLLCVEAGDRRLVFPDIDLRPHGD